MSDLTLALHDGTLIKGQSFGADCGSISGEVVFNTGMSGYIESLTDPSYRGQILVLTYPLVGNYGVPQERRSPPSLEQTYESTHIQVQGLVVQEYVDDYSHHSASRSLQDWLKQEGIPAITGVDTRALTRRLREYGTMEGWLFPSDENVRTAKLSASSVEMSKEVFQLVAPTEAVTYPAGDLKILLVDVGAKDNIVRSLLKRNATVLRVPYNHDLAQHAQAVDGILIGNGPGDPRDLSGLVKQVKVLLEAEGKPILGICLGHQILSLAAGINTYKLPYGHRGVNQPVQDLLSRRCFITSQNHGFVVDDQSLPNDWETWFVNINDGTNEGIRSLTRPFAGVQFHPEACPGPEDTSYLFDDFLRQVQAFKSS